MLPVCHQYLSGYGIYEEWVVWNERDALNEQNEQLLTSAHQLKLHAKSQVHFYVPGAWISKYATFFIRNYCLNKQFDTNII